MSHAIDNYLAHLVDVVESGQYTNDPADDGGPTRWGITLDTLQEYRSGKVTADDVRQLSRVDALDIYRDKYVAEPGFDRLAKVDERIAIECIDTGVNMGPVTASRFLQRCLNVLNHQGADWPDIRVDGRCGSKTATALRSMKQRRGKDGMRVLLVALNCLQGDRYIQLAESRSTQERFIYGWLQSRVELAG